MCPPRVDCGYPPLDRITQPVLSHMTPQDREALQGLLTQLTQIHGVNKDPEADLMIREAVARQPDANYLLVQRALLLAAALDQARTRMAEQARAAQRPREEPLEPPQTSWARGAPGTGGPITPPPSAPAPAAPSLLGQAAATAAGVAGGAFLFQGIEDLVGHHGSPFSGHDAATALPTEDVTVNNYYGERGDEEQRTSFDRDDSDDVTDFGDDAI